MYHKIDKEITVHATVLFKITAFAMQLIELIYILFFTHNKHSIDLKYVFFWEHLGIRLMSNESYICKFELETLSQQNKQHTKSTIIVQYLAQLTGVRQIREESWMKDG